MKKYKAAIIGLGRIGFKYDFKKDPKYILSYARAFSRHKGFELSAGVDIDESALGVFGNAYKARPFHYRNLKEALEGVEVIVVSAPTKKHLSITRDIFKCAKPALLCMEKPLSDKAGEALKILNLCRKHKTALYVNYFRRTDKGINKLKRAIRDKAFGGLVHVNIYYGKDLFENGSHFIDLALYLFGKPTDIKIISRRIKRNPDFVFTYKEFSVFFKSVPETNYNFKEMDFLFRGGRVRYLSLPKTEVYSPDVNSYFGVKELGESKKYADYYVDMDKFMYNVADHVHSFLAKRSKLASNGDTAMRTLEICNMIINNGNSLHKRSKFSCPPLAGEKISSHVAG